MTNHETVKHLRDAQRRLRSVLVANADRLSTPFTDDPSKNPWDTYLRPAVRGLQEAVNAACEALAAPAAVSVPPPAPQAADRRARYAAAIAEGFRAFDADTTSDAYLDAELLDAVVAVADAEEAELLAAVSVVPPATRADDRAAVCICGHTEAQHFEDACVTEVTGCDCGDFLTGEAAREVIARWRDAATRMANGTDLPGRLEAVLTERFTELGNPFPAMRRQEQGPDGWPASHPVGPHHVAEVLRELLDGGPCVAGEQQNETPEGKPGCAHCGGDHAWDDCEAYTALVAQDGPPAPLRRSEDDCPGFPERCPNLRPVDPNPPKHYGGIRCGCADAEPSP